MRNDESGGILLSLTVALGFVLLIISMAMKVKLNSRIVSDKVYAKSSSEFQLESFTQKLGKFSSSHLNNLCANQLQMGSGFNLSGTEARITKTIETPVTTSETADVARRCLKPMTSSNGQFYFCVNIDQNTEHPAHSFLGAETNFAEVAIRLVDKWQRAVNCSTYLASQPNEISMQIYYRFYWIPAGRSLRLNQKSGFYYAVQ
jgi:hypothetical protein